MKRAYKRINTQGSAQIRGYMMDEDWRDKQHYYRAESPCQVCGSLWRTGMEPRFLYVV